MSVNDAARDAAAKATGLRPDQIARVVEEYRAAAAALHDEPQWSAVMHMSGSESGFAVYGAAETKVVLVVESTKVRGEWNEERHYGYLDNAYETYGEARAVELLAATKQTPHLVP